VAVDAVCGKLISRDAFPGIRELCREMLGSSWALGREWPRLREFRKSELFGAGILVMPIREKFCRFSDCLPSKSPI
jgi:hypothetical protein